LVLSACATSTQFVSAPPTLDPPSAALAQPCASPVSLAEGDLSAGEVASGWARDRVSLVRCRDRHGALVEFYESRDAALRGGDE
jgi:hypothetical protein